MVITHNLGFPRIGAHRELKFALEAFWQGQSSASKLDKSARELRQNNWQQQSDITLIPVGDFSLYDQVLDMSVTLGNLPECLKGLEGHALDNYFRVAHGLSSKSKTEQVIPTSDIATWFDSNYHYIVPEFNAGTRFKLDATRLVSQIIEASQQLDTSKIKPVIIGPITYLWLGNIKNGNKLDLLEELLPVYKELLNTLSEQGVEWVQIDEPILTTELDNNWKHAFDLAYHRLKGTGINILLATYFGKLQGNLQLACNLPVQGLHLDSINAHDEVRPIADWLPNHKVLSLGIIDGRNIWKTDLNAVLDWLEPLKQRLHNPLWLAPSCSLLDVPVNLDNEKTLEPEVKCWLAFATQKLNELETLATALNQGREAVAVDLENNRQAIKQRQQSPKTHNPRLQKIINQIEGSLITDQSGYAKKAS